MKIIIIGGGNVGGYIINNINQFTENFQIVGILDDDPTKIGVKLWGIEVLGNINQLEKLAANYEDLGVVISIANPPIKKRIIEQLSIIKNISFPNLIHKNSWFSNNVILGYGNIIYPNASINYETVIHNFVTINMNASLGHNCILHDYVTISPGVDIAGFTDVGQSTFLGLGCNAIQGHKIGENVIVGAGAVIIHDVPDGATVVGNPGRIIKIKDINE